MKLALHWKILIGMALGLVAGAIALQFDGPEHQYGSQFVEDWIKPFGTIFINLLKLVAIPLIVTSLIKGISDLKDVTKLSSMGGRTVVLYLATTVVAITLGLVVVNFVGPGRFIDDASRADLMAGSQEAASKALEVAAEQQELGPLQPLIDVVPENLFSAAANNSNMLQIIFVVVFFGIGMIMLPEETVRPVKQFFDGLNEIVLKLIDFIMAIAPFGVFALLATIVTTAPSRSVFVALLSYCACVLLGLAILLGVFYPLLVWAFTGRSYRFFFRGISPAQLLAFSTSSSAATLPVTMERVEEHLGVDEEVSSFVLPIGATVNMDGTSLYQAVAAVFIAQVYNMNLDLGQQVTIVLTATLASIGTAAVPGAGVVMLVIVLKAIEVPEQGIALILGVDRLLDMCRTVANITGDATVAMIVAKSVGKLSDPDTLEDARNEKLAREAEAQGETSLREE